MRDVVLIEEAADVLAYLRCMRPDLGAIDMREIRQRHFGRDERTAHLDYRGNIWDCWLLSVRGRTVLCTDAPVPGIAHE